jgi:hypothetical protein
MHIPPPSASELPTGCPAGWSKVVVSFRHEKRNLPRRRRGRYRFLKIDTTTLASRPGTRPATQRQKVVVWVFSQPPILALRTEARVVRRAQHGQRKIPNLFGNDPCQANTAARVCGQMPVLPIPPPAPLEGVWTGGNLDPNQLMDRTVLYRVRPHQKSKREVRTPVVSAPPVYTTSADEPCAKPFCPVIGVGQGFLLSGLPPKGERWG